MRFADVAASDPNLSSNRDASGKPSESYDLCVLDLDGSEPQPLGLSANVVLTPVWSYR
jgi:hypothetical protein